MTPNALDDLGARLSNLPLPPVLVCGTVDEAAAHERFVRGLSADASLGDQLEIAHGDGHALAEVVRIDAERCAAALYDRRASAFIGAEARLIGPFALNIHERWLGRAIDALGRPIDDKGPLPAGSEARSCDASPLPPLQRPPLKTPLRTGVKALDIFAPLVEGQRIGIFAGSGVGKSTLLGMLAASASVDVVVAALVGERGREVGELLTGPLAAHRDRTVSVVSTGDETALMRRQALRTAITVAEHFRDEGRRVLLLVDSFTRAAHALRDVALAAGEPPVARGYPPSVFGELARISERVGPSKTGSITGVFCVLVDGDDMEEPVSDAARGTLDGHIVLSREIAESGRFPAIDPLASLSRLAPVAFTADEAELSRQLRRLISRYEDSKDLRLLGGYQAGSDPELDRAVALVPKILEALVQRAGSPPSKDAFAELAAVLTKRGGDGGRAAVSA
ncbi:MAG: FliI/YscN family ATPase [Pseudomonadota bacterium]